MCERYWEKKRTFIIGNAKVKINSLESNGKYMNFKENIETSTVSNRMINYSVCVFI